MVCTRQQSVDAKFLVMRTYRRPTLSQLLTDVKATQRTRFFLATFQQGLLGLDRVCWAKFRTREFNRARVVDL